MPKSKKSISPAAMAQPRASRNPPMSQDTLRKEMLRMVLRDTLLRHGIPAAWIGAEVLTAVAQDGGRGGLHVRLLLRHWDAELVICTFTLQESYHKGVLALDPLAGDWLLGMSWQFDLNNTGDCPPLPPPHVWAAQLTPHQIATQAHLQRMMAAGDEEFRRQAEAAANFGGTFSPTMPVHSSMTAARPS